MKDITIMHCGHSSGASPTVITKQQFIQWINSQGFIDASTGFSSETVNLNI